MRCLYDPPKNIPYGTMSMSVYLELLVSGKISAETTMYDLEEGCHLKVPNRNYRKLLFSLFVLLS